MNVETVTRTIQLVVAPVVMVTACAILLGGLLQRYAAINDRLRAMSRERFDLVYANRSVATDTPRQDERIIEIDFQIPLLLKRHRLAHAAVLAIYSAVAILISDMFVIALAVVATTDWFAIIVLMLFLAGLCSLLIGVLYTTAEVWSSHRAVEYEVQRVLKLPKIS